MVTAKGSNPGPAKTRSTKIISTATFQFGDAWRMKCPSTQFLVKYLVKHKNSMKSYSLKAQRSFVENALKREFCKQTSLKRFMKQSYDKLFKIQLLNKNAFGCVCRR